MPNDVMIRTHCEASGFLRLQIYITFIFVIFGSLCAGFTVTAHAESSRSYEALKQQLQDQKRQQKELEKKAENLEKEISTNREDLVSVGRTMQDNERHLRDLEGRIAELQSERQRLVDALNADRVSIARLVMALQKMQRIPSEALAALPVPPLQTAHTARLMRATIPVLHRQAEDVRLKLAELQAVNDDLEQKRSTALAASQALEKDRAKLARMVESREKLYERTAADLKKQAETVRQIALQAQNLQDLVRRLDDDERRNRKKRSPSQEAALTIPGAGTARLPVTGAITIRYGDPDSFGAPSKGITIESSDKAVVVAPMAGVVRFAGPFKNYGQLVIMEHSKGRHSLIAGLQKIDTVVGQSISAGEPIGFLGRAAGSERPSVYYELRLNGEPINPARIFKNLG